MCSRSWRRVRLKGKAMPKNMHKEEFVTVDPEIMHGTPVFKGTRVSLETLFDYLATGESLNEFLEDFPSVKREQANLAIEKARAFAD